MKNPLEQSITYKKIKDRKVKVKQVLTGCKYQCVRGGTKGEGKEVRIWSLYFVYEYENRTMKPVKIVLRRGRG
jgi:hypothetical protein